MENRNEKVRVFLDKMFPGLIMVMDTHCLVWAKAELQIISGYIIFIYELYLSNDGWYFLMEVCEEGRKREEVATYIHREEKGQEIPNLLRFIWLSAQRDPLGFWGNQLSLQMTCQWSHPCYKLQDAEQRETLEATSASEASLISELPRQGATQSEPPAGPSVGSRFLYHSHVGCLPMVTIQMSFS